MLHSTIFSGFTKGDVMDIVDYAEKIKSCLTNCEATIDFHPLQTDDAVKSVIDIFKTCHEKGGTVWFVGNGGSSSIASHMAIDYSKNGGVRAMAFNDVAAITCMANDLGYHNIFAQQLEYHMRDGDVLVAISSSGKSPNIINAVKMAKSDVITFSGFSPDNPLREMGDYNFYVPYSQYGIVEISHLAILHYILDIICGVA